MSGRSAFSGRAAWAAVVALIFVTGSVTSGAADEPARPGVLVCGGTRGTGLEVVELLRGRGELVTVLARPDSDTALLEKMKVAIVRGDAMNAGEVREALSTGRFWAVVSTLGRSRGSPERPDYIGNRNVIDAAKEAGVNRFVMVSTIGVGESKKAAPAVVRWFLKDAIALKTQAEEHLIASGLVYTIVRPGRLTDNAPSRKAVLVEDPHAFSSIARADLAALLVDALYDRTTERRIFGAHDPTR